MLRTVDTGGINLESLYVLLTGNRQNLKLQGSEFDIITFKQKRISLRDKKYFEKDPTRVLRMVKKELDFFPDGFKPDNNIENLLRNENLKSILYAYLKTGENKSLHVGRFTTALRALVSSYSAYQIITKMHNMGVLYAILNFPKVPNLPELTFEDITARLYTLNPYNNSDPETKLTRFNHFFLSHFCAKHSHLSPTEKEKLLNEWQLKEVVWNTLNPFYQDHIVRNLFCMPTGSQVEITNEPNFLSMTRIIRSFYKTKKPLYSENQNPLFAAKPAEPQRTTHNPHSARFNRFPGGR